MLLCSHIDHKEQRKDTNLASLGINAPATRSKFLLPGTPGPGGNQGNRETGGKPGKPGKPGNTHLQLFSIFKVKKLWYRQLSYKKAFKRGAVAQQ